MPCLITVDTGYFSNTINYLINKTTTLRFPCLLPVPPPRPPLKQDPSVSHCMRCRNPEKKKKKKGPPGKLGNCLWSKWVSFVWGTMWCPTVSSGSLGNKPHRVVFSEPLYSPRDCSRYPLTSTLQYTLWPCMSFGAALQQSQFVAWPRFKCDRRTGGVRVTFAANINTIPSDLEAANTGVRQPHWGILQVSDLSFSQATFNDDITHTWSDAR